MALPRTLLALSALAGLAACQSDVPYRPGGQTGGGGPVVSAPASPVDGEWISTDGVAVSRFQSGAFETLATDTGNKLATGSYRFNDQQTIAITLTSLIRQTTSNVNCSLVNRAQLNCTSDAGQQFVLVRRQRA